MPDPLINTMRHTVHLSTNVGKACEHCPNGKWAIDDIAGAANHYLEEHGYVLLHVGPESSTDDHGKPTYHTVFVVGHDDPPAFMPPATVVLGNPGR